jgi:hypothetical protein
MLDFDDVRENQRAAQFDFILTELDMAITFCETALAADTTAKADRNRKHASDAYAAAIHFAEKARFTPKMVLEINGRIRRLKDLFRELNSATKTE